MRFDRTVSVLCCWLAAFYVLAFVACVGARVTFGFELSWMESGMSAMTERLSAHQSIYAAPTPAYVPFIYPPLYFLVAHALERALPGAAELVSMRLVSIVSTAATACVLYLCLGRRKLRPQLRLLLIAAFISLYGRFECWYDTSRVDSLFVLLLFSSLALLVEGAGIETALLAGALGGLAFLAKQPAAPVLGACALVRGWSERNIGRAVAAIAAAAASAVGGLAAMGELRNPWFYYYVFEVPGSHPLLARNLGRGVAFVVLVMPLYPFASALVLCRRQPVDVDPAAENSGRRWALVFFATTAVMLALRLKQGASINFFLPALPPGIMAAAALFERLEPKRIHLLLLAQLTLALYNPLRAIPTALDWEAGAALLATLRSLPGDVFLPQFPSYLRRLGKRPVAHGVAVCDIANLRPDLVRAIGSAVNAGDFVAAGSWPAPESREMCLSPVLGPEFVADGEIPVGGDFFRAGHASKLATIYRRRDPARLATR